MMASASGNLGERPVYVVDGSRTPFLKAVAGPGPFRASDLAVQAGRSLLARQPFQPDMLDEVILGCVSSGPDEANIARLVALRLGCGDTVPGWTVQRNCGSGMQAVDCAAQNIACGRSNLILAGGTEAMSHHPLILRERMVAWLSGWKRAQGLSGRARHLAKLRFSYLQPVVALLRGLTDPVAGLSMGQTAEILASRFDVPRRMMDEYAAESHQRLAMALDHGRLDEIDPIYDTDGRVYLRDEGLRRNTDAERMARLPATFDRPLGKVTAGNSAQISDGAAWLLLASETAVSKYGLAVLGRILDSQWSALDPAEMGLGPAHAMAPLLRRHRLAADDNHYWEINEAFAAQVLACLRAWEDETYCREALGLEEAPGPIARERLNIDGGGISLGHPVGATGARIVLHLLRVMQAHGAERGMASLCVGGGQGGAMLVGT